MGSLKPARSNSDKWCFSALPRKGLLMADCSEKRTSQSGLQAKDLQETSCQEVLDDHLVLPPPPSFKTVSFAPGVRPAEDASQPIPIEVRKKYLYFILF